MHETQQYIVNRIKNNNIDISSKDFILEYINNFKYIEQSAREVHLKYFSDIQDGSIEQTKEQQLKHVEYMEYEVEHWLEVCNDLEQDYLEVYTELYGTKNVNFVKDIINSEWNNSNNHWNKEKAKSQIRIWYNIAYYYKIRIADKENGLQYSLTTDMFNDTKFPYRLFTDVPSKQLLLESSFNIRSKFCKNTGLNESDIKTIIYNIRKMIKLGKAVDLKVYKEYLDWLSNIENIIYYGNKLLHYKKFNQLKKANNEKVQWLLKIYNQQNGGI